MLSSSFLLLLAAALTAATPVSNSSSLSGVCTIAYAKASLPLDAVDGITIDPSSVSVQEVSNYTSSGSVTLPDATIDYCNVTFTYSHDGLDDTVYLTFFAPAPADFQNRYLSTGGGGYSISSGAMALVGGPIYGAVAGETDGGSGGADANTEWLVANGTVDWHNVYMFSHEAHNELTMIGKAFTKLFFDMDNSTRLYSYYQGCSEGGREGWSQIQRYGDEWDGAAIGAPAFRFSFQQLNHIYSAFVEQTLEYAPPPCEMEKITNATVAACDELDGKADGVVARTDLCKLQFDLDTVIGESYYCAASTGMSGMPGGPLRKRQMPSSQSTPAQNGTVTARGVAVAKQILRGAHDTQGRRFYLSYQPTSGFADAQTTYNTSTAQWQISPQSSGTEFKAKMLDEHNTTTFALESYSYDDLRDWMVTGMHKYADSVQTDWPDLTPFHRAGGKVLHYHGESDGSIPAASSVRYWNAVREIMYPDLPLLEGSEKLGEWYRLYLIPGAGHCGTNSLMPNGPFPQTVLGTVIEWVERGVRPGLLEARVLSGENVGEEQGVCAWPLRPLWTNGGRQMECRFDQESVDAWTFDFDGVKMPVY